MAEAQRIEDDYIKAGICSDCGACSLSDASDKCRPKQYPSAEWECAGERLWHQDDDDCSNGSRGLPVIRELVLTLEYLRFACEHAEGKGAADEKMLKLAMRVGIRVLSKHSKHVPDFQQRSYWEEMREITTRLGLNTEN